MAFTAYIFQEDYDRLITKEVIHAIQQQRGGSVFGQWTSTGNPVIHRVMSFSSPSQGTRSRDAVARELYEGFRVCYIGEWRPVQYQYYNDMHTRESREASEARERLSKGREAPARFLVLDVSMTDIVPFLLNRQTARQESGRLERLPGKNPFNKTESFQAMPRRDNYDPLRDPLAHHAGQPDLPHQGPRVSQFQEATTTALQWYSGDEGSKKLQKVLQGIKEIASRDVEMTRDKRSQDLSLSLVDNIYKKKWEIRFPATFPTTGALLIENPGTGYEKPRSQSRCTTENQAVKNIVSSIKSRSFLT